jgi:hypothetical protein
MSRFVFVPPRACSCSGTHHTSTLLQSLYVHPQHPSQYQLVYSQPCVEEHWSSEPPPDVLMGVVASDSRLGVRALRDWCQALGLPCLQPENRVRMCA